MGATALIVGLLTATLTAGLLPGSAQAQASAGDAARQVHANGAYPERLSILGADDPKDPRADTPGRRGKSFGGGKQQPQGPSSADPPSAVAPGAGGLFRALGALLLVVLAVVALGLAVLVAARWSGPDAGSAATTVPDDNDDANAATPDGPLMALPDEDPDSLAAAGRWDAAILALLLRALRRAGWRPEGRGRSATAREVARDLPAKDARRPTLLSIVQLAEQVRFGGQPASQERYAELRALLNNMPEGT